MLNQDCPDILKKIVATKKIEIAAMTKLIADYKSAIVELPAALDFRASLTSPGLSVIAEIKKASPSAGIIARDFVPEEIAQAYNSGGADAVSILTDKDYFKGDIAYISLVRDIIKVPILRKDFIIDPIQIYEARACGADSFLLIAAILSTNELKELIDIGRELGMVSLVESHKEQELESSIESGAKIFGINNRNLHNFEVDIATSEKLFPLIPENAVAVAESGINFSAQARQLHNLGFNAVLVGESLMKAGQNSCGEIMRDFKE